MCRDDDQSYGMILLVAWVEFDGKPGHHQANANLIAAAPEMLQALQLMVSAQVLPVYHETIAKAVIAKALGK